MWEQLVGGKRRLSAGLIVAFQKKPNFRMSWQATGLVASITGNSSKKESGNKDGGCNKLVKGNDEEDQCSGGTSVDKRGIAIGEHTKGGGNTGHDERGNRSTASPGKRARS